MRCTLHGLAVISDANEQALAAHGKKSPGLPVWLYSGSIFLSAFLLFQVQPILAKLILPWFGGAAAVWVISLAFYQVTYLLGNLYAYILIQRGTANIFDTCSCAVAFGESAAVADCAQRVLATARRCGAGVENLGRAGSYGGAAVPAAVGDEPAGADVAHFWF